MTSSSPDTQLRRDAAGTLPSERAGEWRAIDRYRVRVNDLPNFRILRKDIFERRIYHFESDHRSPRIIDGGANIGLSILYFKTMFPDARIVAFEPDPTILPFLGDNLAANGIDDVSLVEAALSGRSGEAVLHSDGKYGSSLHAPTAAPAATTDSTYTVSCVRLRDYLTEPTDFMKLNIEGAEWDVLANSEDRLRSVRAMVVEYHHQPGLPRTLHRILELLDRCGFDYLINDFDAETNPKSQPPFRIGPDSRYYLLIYGQRRN